jgi:hypothetical protein
MKQEFLVQTRKAAEAAVDDMRDGPLKTAAFQTILTQLLQQGHGMEDSERVSSIGKKKPGARVSSGTTSRLHSLVTEGVFEQQRSLAEIRQILAERGWHYRLEDLGTPVMRIVRQKQLRRTQVTEGRKKIWKYSNY